MRRIIAILFFAAAAFAFIMAVLPHPPQIPGEPMDKVQHIMAFSVLAGLSAFGFPRTSTIRLLISLSLFGAFIEVVQAIPMLHRDCDVLDWVADTIAGGIVLAIAHPFRQRLRLD